MRNTLENLSKNTGDDFKLSDNFKNAITLPEKVTPPINTVKEVINIKIFTQVISYIIVKFVTIYCFVFF